MIRTTLARVGMGIFAALLVAVVAAPGCKASGIGDPCTPEQEYLDTFNGFDEQEVNVESKSFQCQTRLCLVNHFRGRVSCPYGQNADGKTDIDPITGQPISASCVVPGTINPVLGLPGSSKGQEVDAQCVDRTADQAVYCSCRCADIDGNSNDGANYCKCPDGFSCSQLVSSIGQGRDSGLTGAYCIKNGTDYNRATACQATCAPGVKGCP